MCLVGLEAKLSGSVKREVRKTHSSSTKNQQGLQDARWRGRESGGERDASAAGVEAAPLEWPQRVKCSKRR